MRRLFVHLLSMYCADCERFLWPWTARCGPRHRSCKHAGDLAIYLRNDYGVPWDCSYCGASIEGTARP